MARKVDKKHRVLEEQLARALADYDNLVKRATREKEEVVAHATKNLLEELVPVVNSFERAQEHLKDRGLRMALDHLYQVLDKHGIDKVPAALGDKFDSRVHEAIESINGSAVQNGTIASVLARGYKWKDGMVIRPAKVKVYGQKPEKEEKLDEEILRGDYM